MRRKAKDAIVNISLSWCAAVMIVLGAWLPPMIEAPAPPRLGLADSK